MQQVNEDEHVLLLNMHHSVTDGWSYGIIWRELSEAYNSFHKGLVQVDLPPLPVQYADFATWQRRWLAQGAMSQQVMTQSLTLPQHHPAALVPTCMGLQSIAISSTNVMSSMKAL